MGHWLPHAFRADWQLIFTFEEAVFFLVNRLYPGSPTPHHHNRQALPRKLIAMLKYEPGMRWHERT